MMLSACGTGDTRVDPADLDLRDLLGMAPTAATGWDADQRASARKLITDGLKDSAATLDAAVMGGSSQDLRIAKTLAAIDGKRASDGAPALGMVRISIDTSMLAASETASPTGGAVLGGSPVAAQELWLAEQWDQQNLTHLAGRGLDLMSALAHDAGLEAGPVVVVPIAHLAAVAAYLPSQVPGGPARLIVNPIALAALEPNDVSVSPSTGGAAGDVVTSAAIAKPTGPIVPVHDQPGVVKAVGGNPYSFYGSYEECAAAQRDRCESCTTAGNCHPITNTADGAQECSTLDANHGKGYYELCIDLSLAISSVNNCVASHAPSCARNASAADSITTLAANDVFLTDSSCSTALDNCLADIYGAPKGNFPDPIGPDGGIAPPSTDPPRDVSPSCGHGCSNNTSADPDCDCKGGNCGNSLTCSSACAASNSQSGCGGDASGCDSDNGNDDSGSCEDNGGESGDNGSCSGSNDSDTGSCSSDNSGDSCSGGSSDSSGGSCDNSGSSSDSCGSGSSSDSCSSSSGGSSGCGGSGGSDSCGSSGGGDSCGGSSGSSGCSSSGSSGSGCSASKKEPNAILAIAVSATWGVMPVPIAAFVKRRSNRKKKQRQEVQS